MNYKDLKQKYPQYKKWLADNLEQAIMAEDIVDNGLDGNVEALNQIYKQAENFLNMYKTYATLCRELEDAGLHLVAKEIN